MRFFRNPARLETGRIEAFSDGVFAIAITLLVLEIGVPHLEDGQTMLDALRGLLPSLFGYVFGFWVIGTYWANHHYVFSLYKRSNHGFALLNVIFLMTISFLPFPTAVLAEYAADPAQRDGAIVFYLFALTLPALTWSSIWFYARGAHLVDARLTPGFVRLLSIQYAGSVAAFVAIVLVAGLNAALGLALAVLMMVAYALPPRAPEYQEESTSQE
jgi:uncharacterized membrane protein